MNLQTLLNKVLLPIVLFSILGLLGPALAEAKLADPALLLSAGSVAPAAISAADCDHTIGLGVSKADGRGNYNAVRPGDTVCIAAGNRSSLLFQNFQGAAGNPITFINVGGQAVFNGSASDSAISFQNSRFFRLTGSGDSRFEYGIKINGGYSKGVHVYFKSSDLELDHLDIGNISGAGITANNKSNCADGSDNAYDYDGDGKITGDLDDVLSMNNFTQYNTLIHHNHVYDTTKEGFYIGPNATSGITCPTAPTNPTNPVLKGVQVYANTLERIGWDAINVKRAVQDCFVYANTVAGNGLSADRSSYQEGAVNLALQSRCDVYNNQIQGGNGAGIKGHGFGGKIYNNLILSPGQGHGSSEKTGSAMYISADDPSGAYYIWNNTFVTPKSFGIYFDDGHAAEKFIQNNIIINPGASGDSSYIRIPAQIQATASQNLLSRNIADIKFMNPGANNYSLQSGSPAIDAGFNLSAQGISSDYSGVARPQGAKYDIGAFEFAGGGPSQPTPTPIKPTSTPVVATPVSPVPTPTPVIPTVTPVVPTITPPVSQGDYLIRVGDTWRYFKGTKEASNPITAWQQLSFDDTKWLTGPTNMGFGYQNQATVLNDMLSQYVSVFMRRSFQITDPASVKGLTLEIDYDDGFVAYLNGVEIARRQLGNAGTPVAFNTKAVAKHLAGTSEKIDLTSFINLLRPGANVLAVQAHNKGQNNETFAIAPALRWSQSGSPLPTNTPIANPTTTAPTATPITQPTATPTKTPVPPATPLPGGQISASIETEPVAHDTDAADDPAIWIHPADPALSTIIGTDKKGGLEVYDLTGRKLQVIPIETGNVDIRYNFPLGGQRVALVAAFNKSSGGLAVFKVNPTTRMLEDVVAGSVKVGGGGTALYHSPVNGKYYYFSNGGASLRQYELLDNGSGKVIAKEVRSFQYGASGKSEGVVADDLLGQVYASEETVGLWKFSAEPNGGSTKTLIDKPLSQGGHLQPDVEGLTIYYRGNGSGYLIASSQGNNSFAAYTREGQNQYLGVFQIQDGTVDGVSNTDGIDVTNFPLSAAFPQGLFVAQDGSNKGSNGSTSNQNFKLVPWERIAGKLALGIDTGWDPRRVGSNDQLTLTSIDVPAEVAIPEVITDPVAPVGEAPLEPISAPEPGANPISDPSAVNGDVNGDNVVNILDLAYIASQYGSNQPQADVNGNATVDIYDLALAAGNFGQGTPEAPSQPLETPLPQPTDMPPAEPMPTEMPSQPVETPLPQPTDMPPAEPVPTETLLPTATLAPALPTDTVAPPTETPTLIAPTETLTPTAEIPTPTETLAATTEPTAEP